MKIKNNYKISENVLTLCDPMFPLYLIKSSAPILIDTGVMQLASRVLTQIHHLLPNNKIEKILLTHTHWDHTGSLSAITNAHNSAVFASESGASLLKKPGVISFINRMNRDYAGTNELPEAFSLNIPQNISVLHDQDIIEIDHNERLHVFETPGHTRCSLSFFLENSSILFPGDALGVVEKNGTLRPLFLSDFSYYIASIKRLSALPVRYIALPHNTVVSGAENIHAFFANALESSHAFFEVIAKALTEFGDEEKIAHSLLSRHFSNATIEGPIETFKINLLAMIRAVEKIMKS